MKIVGIVIKQFEELIQFAKMHYVALLLGPLMGGAFGLIMGGCYILGALDHNAIIKTPNLPVKSFVQLMITGDYIVQAEDCKKGGECETTPQALSISSASGVKVSNGRILTAAHFCERFKQIKGTEGTIDSDGDLLKSSYLIAVDHVGMTHNLEIMLVVQDVDLCVVKGETVGGREAQLSSRPPYKTERVWNIAAPHGIYFPNAPILLEGFYNGKTRHLGNHYSVHAAPGSSGSPIFLSDGTLVGIIHSVHPTFDVSTYAVPLEDIRQAIEETD